MTQPSWDMLDHAVHAGHAGQALDTGTAVVHACDLGGLSRSACSTGVRGTSACGNYSPTTLPSSLPPCTPHPVPLAAPLVAFCSGYHVPSVGAVVICDQRAASGTSSSAHCQAARLFGWRPSVPQKLCDAGLCGEPRRGVVR